MLTTAPSIRGASLPTAVAPQASARPTTIRPLVERWDVEDKTFPSTEDLLKGYTPSSVGQPATYSWSQTTPTTVQQRVRTAVVAPFVGTIAGAFVGTFVDTLRSAGAVAGAVMTGAGTASVAGASAITLGAALGGALGLAAAIMSLCQKTSTLAGQVSGKLRTETQPDGPHQVFYVNDNVSAGVDLNSYATAPSGTIPSSGPPPWWSNRS